MIQFLQGWSLCLEGRAAEGVARMRTGFRASLATGARTMRPMFCALLAQAYGQVGQLDAAWRMLADALNAVEESGQRYYEAETYRFKGELHLLEPKPDVEQAETCFPARARHRPAPAGEVLGAARRNQSRPAVGNRGRRAQARDLLAPVYGWFTEGFDTADLKDAKALLDELS